MVVAGRKRAESRCRYYTRDEAERIGWDVRHPRAGGQFLEEQEIVDFYPNLRDALGQERPDFGAITKAGDLRLVIECKNEFNRIDQATEEAQSYANAINKVKGFDVRLAVGIAGTPDKFVLARSRFFHGKWIPLTSHNFPLTQLPAPRELEIAIQNNDGTTDVQLPDEDEFYDAAIHISQILRLAKVEEWVRPRVIGAIILALYHGDFRHDPDVALEDINTNIAAAIHGFRDVPADRRELLARTLLLSTESQRLRPAIKDLVHQLERLNVRSIMRSGVDFLGQFYETFLRYGCDTKKMGIVFTPRHITRFCADLVGVKLGMKTYDPACGTGGFLVASYDLMMKEATTPTAKKQVKESLHGCDTNATVWSLAVLNMFFRGDGKSNIQFKSCFDDQEKMEGLFDRVLLNPPYSQEGEPETDFIDHSLRSLQPGGELAVVLKTSVLVDPDLTTWRQALIENHHVSGAISLPNELFYPTAVPTSILLVRAHAPSRTRGTFLARIANDGFKISKKRRVPVENSQLDDILALYRQYLRGGTIATVPNVACVVPRDSLIGGDEICAEQWLPSGAFDVSTYEYWKEQAIRQTSLAVTNYPEIIDEVIDDYESLLAEGQSANRPTGRVVLSSWFTVSTGKSAGSSNYPGGEIPYVSSGDSYNSVVDFVQPPEREIIDFPCISVTGFGQACIQPWRFCARGNGGSAVRILTPRFAMSLSDLLWFIGQINAQRWRFHYGRMAIVSRLDDLEVDSPPANLPPIIGLGKRLRKLRVLLDKLLADPDSAAEKNTDNNSVSEKFRQLASEWKTSRGHIASINKWVRLPAYQQIVDLGKSRKDEIVSLLLEELDHSPDHWFWALKEITGVNPVTPESRSNVVEMAKCWIKWGKEKGYRW